MKRGAPLKRTPIARGTKPLKRTKMSRSAGSQKRSEWSDLSRKHRLAEPGCEMCGAPASDTHHLWSRGRGGPTIVPHGLLRSMCRPCHEWLHHTGDGQIHGRETGWLLSAEAGQRTLDALLEGDEA